MVEDRASSKPSRSGWLMLALVVPLLVLQGVFALKVVSTDLLYFSAQRDVVYWGTEDFQPGSERVVEQRKSLEQAIGLWSAHPDYLALHARILAWQAVLEPDRRISNAHLLDAIASMQRSLTIRPANPYTWAQYAEYLATQPLRRNELLEAVERVNTLAPGDPVLQQRTRNLLGT